MAAEMARLALDAMEGDNEKTKISYLHHWLDGKGISKIKYGGTARPSSARKSMMH